MLAARAEETGSSFLPFEQHRVVAISSALRSGDQLQVWSLGAVDSGEEDLIRRFFAGLEAPPDARLLERVRIRPAGAALPHAAPRHRGAHLLGRG